MKGLLHSKTFRDNLKKWLFMYVGTIFVFTSVVTYSKFVSMFNNSDNARPAKFNIVVEYLDKCNPGFSKEDNNSEENNENPNETGEQTEGNKEDEQGGETKPEVVCPIVSNTRPLENYDFYFRVDTTEIEVKSLVKITTSINSEFLKNATNKENIFEIKEIAVVGEDLKTVKNIVCSATADGNYASCDTSFTDSYVVLPERKDIETVKYYRVSVSHTIQNENFEVGTNNDRVVIVGYSALQEG